MREVVGATVESYGHTRQTFSVGFQNHGKKSPTPLSFAARSPFGLPEEQQRRCSEPILGRCMDHELDGAQLDELLGEVEAHLATLDDLLAGDGISGDRFDACFRSLHTIKSAAGMSGFAEMERVAHQAERLLDERRESASLGPEQVRALHDSVGALTTMTTRLRRISDVGDGELEAGPPLHGAPIRATTAPRVEPGIGEVLVAAGKTTRAAVQTARQAQLQGDPRRLGEILVATGELEADDVLQALNTQRAKHPRAAKIGRDETLERLVELCLQLRRVSAELGAQAPSPYPALETLATIADDLDLVSQRLARRSLPELLHQCEQTAKALAERHHKPVELRVRVAEISVTRAVSDTLRACCMHVIRNAIDHGIESPTRRRALEKEPRGLVCLTARPVADGMVEVAIADDGRGLDSDAIASKAVELGYLPAEQAATLSVPARQHLIFLPGFSTARTVTTTSGRGVGMDAVRDLIESVGGSVALESTQDAGTVVRLRVPRT